MLVIYIVWNNSGYGEICCFMDDVNVICIGVDIIFFDYVVFVVVMGCVFVIVNSLEDLKVFLFVVK